jgi:hypothetical protein
MHRRLDVRAWRPLSDASHTELGYAAGHLTSIEINGTFYRTQTPATYRKWASEVPDGFVFSVKAPRFATHRRVLGEAGDSVTHFLKSGVTELGDRLGPLLWQFPPTKKFEEADFGAFLALFGRSEERGLTPRRGSDADGVLPRPSGAAALCERLPSSGAPSHRSRMPPPISSICACAKARSHRDRLSAAALDWAADARWAQGGEPTDLPHVDTTPVTPQPRDVFAYVIHEGKVRAPAAAMALIERLR